MNEILGFLPFFYLSFFEASKFPQFKFQKFKHYAQMEASIGQARTRDVTYALAIGSIMYAMLCTRPDVNLVVSLVGRYQSKDRKSVV